VTAPERIDARRLRRAQAEAESALRRATEKTARWLEAHYGTPTLRPDPNGARPPRDPGASGAD
jgi:nitrogenase molybdenum-iron protein alpha/beta subunit